MTGDAGRDGGIVVDSVSRSFGQVTAVRAASFRAPPGRVTALIGPNGSGKTTIMLMLASLLSPDAGSIRIDGHNPVTEPTAVRARLGWMPDVLGSWATLSVRATLEYTAALYRRRRPVAVRRATELIGLIGLESVADSPTRVLSRGQKQKLSLARALVHDPSVLLLDEPASGLDPAARIELRMIVRRLAQEGKTILISSHVLSELDEMADGAIYVHQGVTASAESIELTKVSARPWRIKARDLRALRLALDSAGVDTTAITRDRTELIVTLAGEDEAAGLLSRLVASGVPISTFAPAVGDLEHTYLSLRNGTGVGQ